VIVDGSSSLLPKDWDLSSASSARAQEMWLLMPSSQVQAQGVQVARQVERHQSRSDSMGDIKPSQEAWLSRQMLFTHAGFTGLNHSTQALPNRA